MYNYISLVTTHVHMCMCIYVRPYVYVYVYMYVYICMYIHMSTRTYMNIYIYIKGDQPGGIHGRSVLQRPQQMEICALYTPPCSVSHCGFSSAGEQ